MNDDDVLAGLLESLVARGAAGAGPRVEQAFRIAAKAHAGQTRSDGSAYLRHPVNAARIVIGWGVTDADVVGAALLHDACEDSALTLKDVEAALGPRVMALVDHLTKPKVQAAAMPGSAGAAASTAVAAAAAVMGGQASDDEDAAARKAKAARDDVYFGRLLAGPAEAVLIKAADRIDNLRDTITARWPESKKRHYAQEALERILPVVQARQLATAAQELEEEAREVLARLDAGEGDLPDVGPNDEAPDPGAGDEDPVYRRSPHVSFFRNGPDVFLYHDLVGDIMQLHEKVVGFIDFFVEPQRASVARTKFGSEFSEGDLDAFFETLGQHLVLLREGEDDAALTAGWWPVRGPWIVSYRGANQPLALCYKDRRTGDVVQEQLSPLLGRLFELCQGNLALPELVKRLMKEFPREQDVEGQVRAAALSWTHSRRQLLKLLPRPKEAFDLVGLPPYVQSTMPFPLLREAEKKPPEVSIRDYHKLEIPSADDQFEQRETTISHAFRVPHPALENRPYGGQLARVLVERDHLQDDGERAPLRYIEVGGGTGWFARGFLDGLALRAPRLYNRSRYTIVDLAPTLRASQKEKLAAHKDRVRIVGGDAEALPFPDESIDTLIANEMIADLPVVPVRRQDLEDGQGPGEIQIRRWGIDCTEAPGLFFVNIGAWRFLEQIARVLKPGGTAFVSEFGTQTGWPEQSTHLDHPEFSIHFGHLKTIAEKLGLEASVEPLANLVKLDGRVKVLQTTQTFFLTLRTFLAGHGVRLEKIAYTEDMFKELLAGKLDMDRLDGVKFAPCGTRLLGLKPPEFKALMLRRPREAGRTVNKIMIDI